MNESRRRGLDRLAQLHRQHREVCSEMDAARPRFDQLKSGGPTVIVVAHQLFQTSDEIGDLMLDRVGRNLDRLKILEPSAGLGQLYRAVRRRSKTAHVQMIEVNRDCAGQLYKATEGDENASLLVRDFLTWSPTGEPEVFDVVLMNPPFERGVDIQHIERAFRFLKPGGVLVALCAGGPRQAHAFSLHEYELLPPKSFEESGTSVNVGMVRIEK